MCVFHKIKSFGVLANHFLTFKFYKFHLNPKNIFIWMMNELKTLLFKRQVVLKIFHKNDINEIVDVKHLPPALGFEPWRDIHFSETFFNFVFVHCTFHLIVFVCATCAMQTKMGLRSSIFFQFIHSFKSFHIQF